MSDYSFPRVKWFLLTVFTVFVGMTLYELLKGFLFPGISLWESHLITIFFSTILASVTAYFILLKFESMHGELERRIDESRMADIALRAANDELEIKVATRTKALALTNEELKTDINKRELIEEELRASELKFRTLIEATPIGIALTTRSGRLVELNTALVKMLGYDSREELIARPTMLHYKNPDDRQRLISEMAKKGFVKNLELELIRKDGKYFTGNLISKVLEGYGDDMLFLTTVQDITEQRVMAAERVTHQKLESLGVLAGGIAHDFNNLLTGILGNIELMKYAIKEDDPLYKRIDEAQRGSLYARELTKQLLTFSKGGTPVKEVVELAQLIDESVALSLHGSSIKCICEIAPDLSPVEVDRGQINQVLNNLIINGSQAMAEGGEIHIYANNITLSSKSHLPLESGQYVSLVVEDSGSGIAPELLSKIFDPYFTTKQEGNGLGLASVYSIISGHNGHIEVASEPGKGSSFSILLPVSKNNVKTEDTVAGQSVSGSGRVLVMDDEKMVLEVACEFLRSLGYETEGVFDGREMLERYKEALALGRGYDLVLMDLTIRGGMGGREAISKLLELDPEAKAVVSSGYSGDQVMANYESYGFKAVAPKPYTVLTLGEAISKALGSEEPEPPGLDEEE